MAAKGGGSWKVAYADFVTAMMAFFLVMWIGSQDAKTRQAVANYFIDPTGADAKPGRKGSVFEDPPKGSVPGSESTNTARGNESPTKPGEHGPATAVVMRWVNADDRQKKKWLEEAVSVHEFAARSPDVVNGKATLQEIKVRELSMRLRNTFVGGNPTKASDIYQDLMLWSINEVNWDEIATELIGK